MKRILTFLCLIISITALSKELYDVRVHGNSFSSIDSITVDPSIAYNNAQNWILNSSSSYKSAIQFESSEQKKLIAKSGVEFPFKRASNEEPYIIFDLSIEIKQGKVRVKLNNIKRYTILHYSNVGGFLGEMLKGEPDEAIENDINSLYIKDEHTGEFVFTREYEYQENLKKLEDLRSQREAAKKKKDKERLDKEIKIAESHNASYEKEKVMYLTINSSINAYIESLIKELNMPDDF